MVSVIRAENDTCQSLRPERIFTGRFCDKHFDNSLCWYPATAGAYVDRECPFKFCKAIEHCKAVAEAFKVFRVCSEDGIWQQPNYNNCLTIVKNHRDCVEGFCHSCPDVLREVVISVSLTLSIISVVLLLAAIILFSMFDSIQCRRLSIHKNLATAFVFRFSVMALWTIAQTTTFFYDCSKFNAPPLRNLEIYCKLILWLVIYFQVASVMWMLIEGAYLYSRFTVFAMRHNDAPYGVYLFCGWGVPFLVVGCWTIVHAYRSGPDSFCWVPYAQGSHLWILSGTMGFALILNLLFLLAIVVILVQKLRTESSAESKKIWRTIKATLLLVPLLGVSNIPLFYEPQTPTSAYMLGSAILQHSQGIFIAVLYCFLNSEIQSAVRRQLSKVPLTGRFINRRQRFETERTYVPPEEGRRPANSRRLGLPMEELNGSSPSREAQPPGYGTQQSNGHPPLATIPERDSQTSS